MFGFPRKTTLTILVFLGLLAATDVVPVLHDYKVMDWTTIPSVLEFSERRPSAAPEVEEQQRLRPDTDPNRQEKHAVLDPSHQLDNFYKALHRAASGNGAVRILHYGDSPTTADLITSDVRKLMQKQFGDAGHGFCLIAKPWAWYAHQGVDLQGAGWTIDPANQSGIKDGLYGLGGVSFRGGPGASSRIRLKDPGYRRAEVAYLRQPGGGQLRVWAGEQDLGVIDTDGEMGSGFASFDLPDGGGDVQIKAMSGPVRVFGVGLEKANPGVIYHSLGVNGAYVSVLAKFFGEAHWREQLQHYQPDLIIVNYGTNESMYPQFVDYTSEKEMKEIVRRIRKAVPGTSILIMSPMDRGQRMAAGIIGTVPAIPRLVAIQQRVAQETGTGFFNTFNAMGGVGTMGRWYEAEPRLVGADFIHPMPAGARIVGGLLYQALLDGYNKYKLRLLETKTMVAQK